MEIDSIFSSSEFEQAYQLIKQSVTNFKKPVENPIAIVLGGQPGAGKSNIYKIASERFDKNIVELDCDKFREYHPESEKLNLEAATYGEKTNPFVFAVVDRLVDELSEQKYNMIIESSMKTPNTAFLNYDLLTPKGYKLEAHIMATPKEVSWQGVVDRYNEQLANGEQARIVPKEFHDLVVENLPNSADAVYKSGKMSNMLVFNRNKEILYDMSKTPELSPKELIDSVVNGRSKEIAKAETKPSLFSRSAQKAFSSKAAELNSNRPAPNIQKNNDIEK